MFRRQVSPPRSPRRFPRIRGDVPRQGSPSSLRRPFSPHTRGCSSPGLTVVVEEAVFPTYAGMFRCRTPANRASGGFPRIRGDVPRASIFHLPVCSFPPHTRGCSGKGRHEGCPEGVFPAYAGMFRPDGCGHFMGLGFPRIRGDIPEARPAMRKILPKKYSQQGSLFNFQTFRSGDRIKLALTFTKPRVDFLCPN